MEPTRIQLSRRKGWRMPPNTKHVGRPTIFGNRFVVDPTRSEHYEKMGGYRRNVDLWTEWPVPDAATAVAAYRAMQVSMYTTEEMNGLRGKNLACWCALNKLCHADVLLEIANRPVCDDPTTPVSQSDGRGE